MYKRISNYLVKYFIYTFISLVIFNYIKYIESIHFIGRYGKVLLPLIGILVLFPFLIKRKVWFNRSDLILLVLWIVLDLFFAINFFVFKNGSLEHLLSNFTLPLDLLFYYTLIKSLIIIDTKKVKIYSYEVSKIKIFKYLRNILFFNIIIWTLIAIGLGVNLIEVTERKIGLGLFMNDSIHFGLYAVAGFYTSFYLRNHKLSKDKSNFNNFLLFFYFFLVFASNSRNAELMVLITIFFYFFKKRFRNIELLIFLTLIGSILFLYVNPIFSFDDLNKISTGRLLIWTLALNKIVDIGLFHGSGFFNLNDLVKNENVGTGFYYLDQVEYLPFHSSYIDVLAAGGLLGLSLFLIILYRVYLKMSKLDKSIFFATIIGGFQGVFLVQPFIMISFIFWVLFLTNNLKEKTRSIKVIDKV